MLRYTLLLLLFLGNQIFLSSIGEPARQESRIQAVYDNYQVSGEGVIVAILDRGIDYRHPAFLNPDGTTRLAYIYDMVNPEGANVNPYGIGTIFSPGQINASLAMGGEPLSMDLGGHGTATTSIAAGNGAGAESVLDVRGVAHGATILAVKMIQDPFPAGNGQAAQSGFFNADYIDEALQFVADKAELLNLPAVALMNFGSIGGPTDGTSAVCQVMEEFVAKGHLLVCGVGDDGGGDNSAAGTIDGVGNSLDLKINKAAAGNLRLDLYYDDTDRFEVTLTEPDGTVNGPYAAPGNAATADVTANPNFNLFHRGSAVDFFGAESPRRQILVDLSGPTGEYTINLRATQLNGSGGFQASLNPATYNSMNGFTTLLREGHSINDYSSAPSVISPGDYVVDNTWTDINGFARGLMGQGDPGEIWIGSSEGPTNDNRLGIDLAAPGEVLFAAYSPGTFYSRFAFNTVENSNGLYGIQNAVSAAAPLLTGVIALLLEMDPTLTQAEVKDILQRTARQDAFTGAVPNNTWGYGKLDALAAAAEVNRLVGTRELAPASVAIAPNPVDDRLRLRGENLADWKELCYFEVSGRRLGCTTESERQDGVIAVNHLPSGIYWVSGIDQDGRRRTGKFVKR